MECSLPEAGLVDSKVEIRTDGRPAAGVNAYLKSAAPLTPQYQALELSRASIPPGRRSNSYRHQRRVFPLTFACDADTNARLAAFQQAGAGVGFDGTRLFEDVFRIAPFEPTVTVPGKLSHKSEVAYRAAQPDWSHGAVAPEAAALAGRYL